MESLEFTLWPTNDKWPKENRWLEWKESRYDSEFHSDEATQTADFNRQPPYPVLPTPVESGVLWAGTGIHN